MEICYLPVEKLVLNEENLFTPLSGPEYEDLRGSIARYGIQEPLIVTHGENGFYIVVSGNNRLRIAGEIGIKTLPCSIIDITSIEGAIDTEIFRRHLSPKDRERYKTLKEEKCGEIFEREIEKKLLPELFEKYQKGLLGREFAVGAIKLNTQQQAALLETIKNPQPASTDDDGEAEFQEEIAHLKEVLSTKTQEIRELKSWKEENRERLEEKLAELEKKKSKASEVVRKEFEAEAKNLMETNEKLASQIRQKQAEIDKIEEEKEKFKRLLSDKEIEIKAEKIQFAEVEQEYMLNITIVHLDMILKEIETIRNHMEFNLSRRDASIAEEKIKNIHKELEELSAHINKSSTFQQQAAGYSGKVLGKNN